MSSLGDLLLAHLKQPSNKIEKVSDSGSCDYNKTDKDDESNQEPPKSSLSPTKDHPPSPIDSLQSAELLAQKVFPERIVKNDVEDTQSNASSTDDYVRELLDPDDRPKNVWHVVEGPKVQPNSSKEVQEDSNQSSRDNDSSELHDIDISNQLEHEVDRENKDGAVGDEVSNDVEKGRDMNDGKRHGDRRSSKTKDRHRGHREVSRERSSSSRRHRRSDRDRDHDYDHDHDDYDYDLDRDRSSKRRREYLDDDYDDDDRRRRDSHRSRRRSRSRSKTPSRRRGRSRSDSQSPITKRNSRTILIMQLNPKVNSRDLEDFFNDIGRVREVRLIMDSKTRRHKGIAYIEFEEASSATKAFSLNGQKFFGAPVVIQSAQTDRNRSSGEWHSSTSQTVNQASSNPSSRSHLPSNCYRVYVGGLNVHLTEEMIRAVFEPFGPIIKLELMKDRVTNISRGYAFITYANIEDGQNAVQALDGFELGGKALRVSKSTEKVGVSKACLRV